jgi:hypothetical protein
MQLPYGIAFRLQDPEHEQPSCTCQALIGDAKSVELEIRTVGQGGQEDLAALNQWLASQRGLTGRVRLKQSTPGEQDLGGGAFELLTVALGSGGTMSVLAGAFSAWLSSRRNPSTIRISIPGGGEIEVPPDVDEAKLERLIRMLREPARGD